MEKNPKFNKRRAFNKAVGPGKTPILINVWPTFIPDYRVFKICSFGISCLFCGYLRKVETNQLLIWQIYLHMENSYEEFCLFHGCWPS